VKGVPVVMKDIRQEALDLGLNEASSILLKGMKRGRVKPEKMASTLANITATLNMDNVAPVDVVVEAVVENPKIKASVLAETEQVIGEEAILCSNTSTISIDHLAENLARPENFCGMHFFNPVHRMPLVEIIRGKKTSEDTIAKVVAYSLTMGKTPIVVNDCPGFFVNRVLFPYFAGFSQLVLDGADFVAIDKVMEKQFGWPMGPAMLLDVVGIDTADHAAHVMADGIPERLALIDNDPTQLLYKADRLGQKNNKGFYNHSLDKRGRPAKVAAEEAYQLIAPHSQEAKSFEADEIIARMMIPMANEAIRCLEEGIIASPEDADMSLLYGLGFPPFRGGIFRYIESVGIAEFVALAARYEHLGPMYVLSDGIKSMAEAGQHYFQQ
jgi:3-hydroxyacyl-CoA dehydrogenase/enoyl-CoA hydratase/3-hydroxybutyryl-CoA epimerase/enoyl-CoA isomerase